VIDRSVGTAIANRSRKRIDSNHAHMAIRVEEVNVSGDLAYDRISYTVTIIHDQQVVRRRVAHHHRDAIQMKGRIDRSLTRSNLSVIAATT
jgi:hypothetical protein